MPYYTAVYGKAGNYENAGSGYSKYLITDLLRNTYHYDEVVCTDWSITEDASTLENLYGGKCWGAEKLTRGERCYRILMAGVDQFGGLNEKEPVLDAYRIGVKEHGETFMRKRLEQSAVRLLKNIFRVGLFENPYFRPGSIRKNGWLCRVYGRRIAAQKKSIVMLKNKENVLPLQKKMKVYVPKIHWPESETGCAENGGALGQSNFPRTAGEVFHSDGSSRRGGCSNLYHSSADGAAFGLAGGYDVSDKEAGGNGYLPISLQYRPYTAVYAREHSIAPRSK